MDAIEGKLYAPWLKKTTKPVFKEGLKFEYETELNWEKLDATVSKIRLHDGYPVKTFRKLIDEVALVTISNRNYEMFYRGQRMDYKSNQSVYYKNNPAKSIIYPAICRPEKRPDGSYKPSLRKEQLLKRYDDLDKLIAVFAGRRSYHPEFLYAMFQHYDILPTPLIDLTQSLRVAATFALRNTNRGYVYVFGLPYPNQSISHYADMGIVLVKLQNICPVQALRPRYQEGYLVGKYPIRPVKSGADNLARRLVAKFRLENDDNNFWDKDFQPMPEDVLLPKKDKFEADLIKAKESLLKNRGAK